MVVNSDWAQVEAIELENDGSGLAFGIIGGRSTGVVVKTILPGGVADRDGRLQSGDHILRIGEVSMRGLGCEQAAAVLRQCGVRVRLLVARAADPTAEFRSLGASNAPIVPTKVLGDPDELDRALLESGYTEGLVPPSPAPLVDRYEDRYVYHRGGVDLELLPINVVDVVRAGIPPPLVLPPPRRPPAAAEPQAPPMLPLDAAIRGGPAAPELETFSVSLSKDVYGLGITVAGYVCEEEELSGIFVKSISTGSSADLCNKIQINDRIVEVDGQPLQSVSNHQAVELLRCTGSIVRLRLERFLRGPRYERLQKALKGQGGGGGPPSPSVTSLPACAVTMYEESSVIDPEMESRATVDYPPPGSPVSAGSADVVTDPGPGHASPGSRARGAGSPQEDKEIVIGREPRRDGAALRAIQDKWREILSLEPDGDIDDLDIVVGMMMKEPGGGLGISLEGTVEVRGGREVRPHHYIRSLLQDGPVGRSGQLRAGDELLEVNGRRLLGLHHLEVVRALKQLPASVCLVCARRPKRRTLIDTAQHKAAFAARNILGGSLQNLLPPPERMIKAKSESSITSACSTNATIASTILGNPSIKSRSRSLEPVSGLAMWSDQPEVIDLVKGDRGLGFSILDYQDPVEPRGTVIVVRSVVPGGAAARGGRLRPGDRLLSVNGVALSGASLATAVRALKAAPKGVVKIGVAKPLPTSSLGSGDRCKRNDSLSTSSQHYEALLQTYKLLLRFQNDVKKIYIKKELLSRKKIFKIIPKYIDPECVNSADSDDHTGFDSYHECLQEYQECLEVVQICLEPEDPSLREDDMSNLEDFSFEEMKNDPAVVNGLKTSLTNHKSKNGNIIKADAFSRDDTEFYNVRDLISDNLKYNGTQCDKLGELRKSDDSLDGNDEDMTITEDEHNLTKLSIDTKISDGKSVYVEEDKNGINAKRRKSLSKDQNRDLSTSDEMVFAVTPTGLERISFERYWKDGDVDESSKESERVFNPDSLRSDESWKDCHSVAATPSENMPEGVEGNVVKSMRSALFENSIQFIDHDIEGYDTCIEDDSLSMKVDDRITNNNIELSDSDKSDRTNKLTNDTAKDNANEKSTENSLSLELVQNNMAILASDKNNQNVNQTTDKMNNGACINANSLESLAAKKNIIKIIKNDLGGSRDSNLHQINNNAIVSEIKSNEIIEINVESENQSQAADKPKKKVHRIRVVEYYNDQAECLEEYMRQKKIDDEEKAKRETIENNMRAVRKSRTSNFLKQINQPSEDSTDQETVFPVMGCHQCFLENYAYELTQAYFSEASKCKFCAVIKEMLEPPKRLPERSHSAPAIMDKHYKRRESRVQVTSILEVPTAHKDRRKSAGPLKFFPCRIENIPAAAMTVSRDKCASQGADTDAIDRHWGRPRRVSVARVPNASLGISIVGGKVDITNSAGSVNSASDVVISGIFIKNVVANSPAGLSGQLRTGDRILEVDGEDVRTASHERAVQIIRAAGDPVTFLVQSLLPWNTDSSDIDSHKQVNSSTDTLSESPPAKSGPSPLRAPPSPTKSIRAPASPSIKPPASLPAKAPLSPPHQIAAGISEAIVPELSPTPSLKRSKAPDPPKTPDFEVTAPDSPPLYEKPKTPLKSPAKAKESLEIDSTAPVVSGGISKLPAALPITLPLTAASPAKSIPGVIPSPSKSSVGVPASSDVTPTAPEAVPPPLPEKKEKIVYSDDEDSDEEEEEDRRELEGRTYTPKGVEIDRASAGNVKRTKEEKEADPEEEDSFGYTTNKVRKKYANLGHAVVAVQLERSQGGLGLSLAGHKDRARMAVFVCGLRPGGAASRTGAVLVGDEILEVNGVVLHGRCHLNASAIIKGLAGPVFKVILLRRLQAIDDLAVKPITQFPVSLEEETDENRYSAYKNVRSVTIKKGTQSLGIMIIEGRHAEVGQGIFISDIQEGSAAEQAGLAIGDMILAVNKDTLLGSNYDTAASMLKKTEGVVVLMVCNPNKKGEEGGAVEGPSTLTADNSAKAAVTPARVPTPGGLRGPPSTHPSRPNTPAGKLSLASPAKEPMADPTTAAIVPGKETLIDITTESKPLGIHVVGGQDTLLPGGMVILEVYPDGKAAKDGRLKPGDQLLECNGVKITPEMKNEKALSLIKQTLPRMKMLILRPETVAYTEIEVDLLKKPGKGVGLTVMAKKPPPGVYISDLVHGGVAELDGRLQKGDIVVSVNGQSLKEATCEEAAAALKCAQAKVTLKVARHKLAR